MASFPADIVDVMHKHEGLLITAHRTVQPRDTMCSPVRNFLLRFSSQCWFCDSLVLWIFAIWKAGLVILEHCATQYLFCALCTFFGVVQVVCLANCSFSGVRFFVAPCIIGLSALTYIFQLLLTSLHARQENLLTHFRCTWWPVSLLRLKPVSFPFKPLSPARIICMFTYIISCNTFIVHADVFCPPCHWLWLTCWTHWRLLPHLNSVKVKRPLSLWPTLPPSLSKLVLLERC